MEPFSSDTTSDDGAGSEGVSVGGSSGRSGLVAVGGTGEGSRIFLGFSRAGLVSLSFCVSVAIGELEGLGIGDCVEVRQRG